MSYKEIDRLRKIAALIESYAEKFGVQNEQIEEMIFNILSPKKNIFAKKDPSILEIKFIEIAEEHKIDQKNEHDIRTKINYLVSENQKLKSKISEQQRSIRISEQNKISLLNNIEKNRTELENLDEFLINLGDTNLKIRREIDELNTKRVQLERERSELNVLVQNYKKQNDILEYDNNNLKLAINEKNNADVSPFFKYFLTSMTILGIVLALYFIIFHKIK